MDFKSRVSTKIPPSGRGLTRLGWFFVLPAFSMKRFNLTLCSFKAVGETLVDFGRTRLGGQIGLIAVLHTWNQTLLDHFHLHCLVPAGALSFDQRRWSPARKTFCSLLKP